MWETLKEIFLVLAGGVKDISLLFTGFGISIASALILGNRSRKFELEDKKRQREKDAREIRFKEGEELIKEYSSQVDHFERILNLYFNAKDESDRLRNLFSVNMSKKYPSYFNKPMTCQHNSVFRSATPH